MTSFTLALLLQASLATTNHTNSYAAAHKMQVDSGRPLVVLVGTDWCPACRQMKDQVIPQARRKGLLKRVAFAVVNADHEHDLARRLMRGGSIPQLVMFERRADGTFKRTQLTGAQSVESLTSFIDRAAPAEPAPATTAGNTTETKKAGS